MQSLYAGRVPLTAVKEVIAMLSSAGLTERALLDGIREDDNGKRGIILQCRPVFLHFFRSFRMIQIDKADGEESLQLKEQLNLRLKQYE